MIATVIAVVTNEWVAVPALFALLLLFVVVHFEGEQTDRTAGPPQPQYVVVPQPRRRKWWR